MLSWIQILAICSSLYVIVMWILRRFKVGNYDRKYVFITGCDTGFGNLLTKRLDKLGFHVFAGCLTQAGIKELKQNCSTNVVTVDLDVTSEESINKAREFVGKKLPRNQGK